jgi:predicted ATP-dependent protease
MVKSKVVFDYVTALPPPSYQFAKYTDWIRPLVLNYPNSYKALVGFASASSVEKNNVAYKETVSLLGEYEKMWAESTGKQAKYTAQQNVLLAFPQPYMLGKPIEEKIILTEKKGDVTLVVSELVTEVFESLPTGKENLGIPADYWTAKEAEKLKEADSEKVVKISADAAFSVEDIMKRMKKRKICSNLIIMSIYSRDEA